MDVDSKTEEINAKALNLLYNILIPESDSAWPEVGKIHAGILHDLSPDARRILSALCLALEATSAHLRVERVQAFEQENPALFARVLKAVYTVYYTNPAVLERVHEIADAAPREPSPHLDLSLLAQVRARQPGRRRL